MQVVGNFMQVVKTICKRFGHASGTKLHASTWFELVSRSQSDRKVGIGIKVGNNRNYMKQLLVFVQCMVQRIVCSYQVNRDHCNLDLLISPLGIG